MGKQRRRLLAVLGLSALAAGLMIVGIGSGSRNEAEELPVFREEEKAESCFAMPRLPGPAETINLLLIGQDKKPQEPGSRSDSMILCSICPDTKVMTFTSILRDLYVEIPGHGKNRVNAAYAFGGPRLLKVTLQKNLGLVVDGYAEVDFENFAALMDLLGGVPLELRKDEAREISRVVPGSQLHEGSCILTGEEALAYSRIRNLDSDADVSRTERQRKVLEAVFHQYQDASAETLIEAVRQAIPMVKTDLKLREILALGGKVLPMIKNLEIKSFRIPAPGTYRDLEVDSMAVLDADLEANRKYLGEILCPVNNP